METIVVVAGVFNLLFGIFHIAFWRLFKWKDQLSQLSFANRGIMQILNWQIVYYFFATAIICFTLPNELLTTRLGNIFLVFCSGFWFFRTIEQFIYLRKNRIFIHLLTFLFSIGAILFALPIINRLF